MGLPPRPAMAAGDQTPSAAVGPNPHPGPVAPAGQQGPGWPAGQPATRYGQYVDQPGRPEQWPAPEGVPTARSLAARRLFWWLTASGAALVFTAAMWLFADRIFYVLPGIAVIAAGRAVAEFLDAR